MADKCRHRKTWLLAGGHLEWCYECGAIRQMDKSIELNSVFVRVGDDGRKARFIRPTGKGGDNPYKKLVQ